MPLNLSAVATQEKNKLGTGSVWLVMLELTIPGLTDTVRAVQNKFNVTWRGKTWVAFNYDLAEVTETTKGEVPRVDLRVSNVARAMESYLQEWDIWTKANGYQPILADIFVVNSKNLADANPSVEFNYQVKQPKADSQWLTLVLSADNPFNRRFPPNRIYKNTCPYRLKSDRCGYRGTAAKCGHTLANCRALGNTTSRGELRYGGCIGVGSGGLQITNN